MRFVSLGNSGLKVSRICLGTNNFGGYVSDSEAAKILDKAMDCGLNFIDTADIYSEGRSEEVVGKLIKGRRDDLVVATKVGMDPRGPGLSRKNMMKQLDLSLSRLQTSYVDLYYAHQFDPETPLLETLQTFDEMVKSGKVRYTACSNFSKAQLADALNASKDHGLESFVGIQSRYNLLQRDIEADIIPFCDENKVSVLAYNPLRAGLLAGRYSRNEPPKEGTRAFFKPGYWSQLNSESNFDRLRKFRSISEKHSIGMPELAVAWTLDGVACAVVGASTPKQIEESCEAADVKLEGGILEELDRV